MKDQDYHVSLNVNATPQQVFDAINNICGWWSEDFEGASTKHGDVFTVRFDKTFITMKVMELIPGKRILWLVTNSFKHWMQRNHTEWIGTTISFDLAETDHQTEIRFTHHGLVPQLDCYDVCTDAWGQYIRQSLRSLISTGTGQPTKKDAVTA
jgi:hypothetical protein